MICCVKFQLWYNFYFTGPKLDSSRFLKNQDYDPIHISVNLKKKQKKIFLLVKSL